MPTPLAEDGWALWAYAPGDASPYLYRQVELMRQEWATPCCVNPWNLPPQMNVADLYWRPLREDDA